MFGKSPLGVLFDIVKDSIKDESPIRTGGYSSGGIVSDPLDSVAKIITNSEEKEINDIIKQADDIISNAKLKYEREEKRTKNYIDETNRIVKEEFNFKKDILFSIKERYQPIINRFDEFKMYSSIYEPSRMNTYMQSSTSPVSFSSFARGMGTLDIFSIIGSINRKKRKENAKEYLAEAKDFRNEVNSEISKLGHIVAKAEYIRKVVEEEHDLLKSLSSKLTIMTDKLTNTMNKSRITEAEKVGANYALDFSKYLIELLNARFITDEGTLSKDYEKVLSKIRIIENDLRKVGI